MVQAEGVSSELEVLFKEWFKARSIEVVLFDFDDTLIDTNTLFGDQVSLFHHYCLERLPGVSLEDFMVEFSRIDTNSFDLMGVVPQKWDYVVEELVKLYGVEDLREGVGFLHDIYQQAPRAFDGVTDTLDICRKGGLRLGLITHANQSWTDIKLDKLNLRGYFEHIKVIDVEEHRYKDASHWQEIVEMFGVEPRHVVAVGDNLQGDITAANNVGIETLVWIPSRWHVYNRGSVPQGVYQIEKISHLIPALINVQRS